MAAVPLLAVLCLPVAAAGQSPAGLWKTIDDKTGKPRGLVRIYEQNGQFFGRIQASFDPKETAERCDKCTDDRKDQPVIGMVILRRLKKSGAEYDGGDILDPDTGTIYRCKLRLEDQGRKLLLRGYLGISLLGRSQTWLRQE